MTINFVRLDGSPRLKSFKFGSLDEKLKGCLSIQLLHHVCWNGLSGGGIYTPSSPSFAISQSQISVNSLLLFVLIFQKSENFFLHSSAFWLRFPRQSVSPPPILKSVCPSCNQSLASIVWLWGIPCTFCACDDEQLVQLLVLVMKVMTFWSTVGHSSIFLYITMSSALPKPLHQRWQVEALWFCCY